MKTRKIALLVIFLSLVSSASAVEYLITDTSGNALNTTTNVLNLGDNPTPKTIQIWLTYNDTERTVANTNGGLYSGGARITPANTAIAVPSAPFTNPSNQWNPFNPQPNIPSNPTIYQVTFSRGASNPDPTLSVGIQLPATVNGVGKFLLFEATVTAGSNVNPIGTNFTIASVATAPFRYGTANLAPSGPIAFSLQPQNYVFMVVPEPTTYALGAVATAMLGGVGFYRRKKSVKSS